MGTLRRIVQLYPAEELDGLKGVLRQWRALGGRVTRKTAEEIVGMSIVHGSNRQFDGDCG